MKVGGATYCAGCPLPVLVCRGCLTVLVERPDPVCGYHRSMERLPRASHGFEGCITVHALLALSRALFVWGHVEEPCNSRDITRSLGRKTEVQNLLSICYCLAILVQTLLIARASVPQAFLLRILILSQLPRAVTKLLCTNISRVNRYWGGMECSHHGRVFVI